jgi:hypothetical protein
VTIEADSGDGLLAIRSAGADVVLTRALSNTERSICDDELNNTQGVT